MKRSEETISRRQSYLARVGPVIAAAVVGCAAFAPTLRNGFVLDDDDIVLDNPLVTEPGSIFRFWTHPYWPGPMGDDHLLRPVTIASFRLNYLVHGSSPAGYHLVNMLLHAVVSALVAALAIRWWSSLAAGWIAGLLYAVHPIHVEAVAPVVGRSELLVGVFGLTVLYLHITMPTGSKHVSPIRAIAMGVLFFLALASKEHAVFLYPVVIVLDLWKRRTAPEIRRLSRRDWLNRFVLPQHLTLLLALSAFLLVRWNVFDYRLAGAAAKIPYYANPLPTASLAERMLTPFALLALSIRLMVWPEELTTYYDIGNLSLSSSVLDPSVLAGISLVVAALVGMMMSYRRQSVLAVVLAAFLICMLLPCQFIAVATWFFAERWLYLPSVFLALAVAGLGRVHAGASVVAAIMLSAALLPNTLSYAGIWSDEITMHLAAHARRPGSFYGQINTASALMDKERYEEAAPFVKQVVARFGDAIVANEIALRYYLDVGNAKNAEAAMKRICSIEPLYWITEQTRARLKELKADNVPASQPGSLPTDAKK